MGTRVSAIFLGAVLLATTPVLAHQADSVQKAERAGRWLQLEQSQVDDLARFITETKLERRERARAMRPELLAILDQEQKARLAELMINRELRLPRRSNSEQKIARLEQALQLSTAQVIELRSRSQRLQADNESFKQQRRVELAAIVGAEKAAQLERLVQQRRQRRQAQQ